VLGPKPWSPSTFQPWLRACFYPLANAISCRTGFNWWEAWGPVYLGQVGLGDCNNFMIKTARPRLASNKINFCF